MGTVYYPCAVSRSDGCRETATGRDGSKEPNTPTANQKDDTPKATNDPKDPAQLKYVVDCYKKLDDNDLKAVEWRRKLGGMLMSILTKDNKELKRRNWILKELPEGYELWEHLKYKVTYRTVDGKEKQTDGNFERQDAYLYGHPQGRKKRYRSPADFLPHLLWLAVDKEGDSKNCSCKVCSPDASDEQMDEVKGEDITLQPSINTDSKAQVIIPSRSQPPQANAPAVALSTPRLQPPAPKHGPSPEQLYDSQSGGLYLYRPGELVWWENEPSNNWRLGVISRRGLMNNAPRYLVQPLSNPYEAQNPKILNNESSLRPWLAWSLPPTTIPILQSKGFEDVPWDRVVRGDFDQNQSKEYVVDGSILAARSIDASYSFFDRNESALAGPGEVHYNGMFLGGEKLWVGEPVRMRGPPAASLLAPDILVLVVHKLIERTTHTGSSVTIIGEVYKWVEMPTPYTSRTQWPTPNLPPRMVADLRFRNEIADNAKTGMWYEWRLLDPLAKKSLLDIKGRWYETKNLLPTLAGAAKFRQDVALGKLLDANEWMNARLDNNPVPEQRRKNRADTFGRAVPPEFKVSRGLAGDPADDLFPDQMQANMEQYMEMGQGQSQQQQQFYAGLIQL